jgi:hypothetical protein
MGTNVDTWKKSATKAVDGLGKEIEAFKKEIEEWKQQLATIRKKFEKKKDAIASKASATGFPAGADKEVLKHVGELGKKVRLIAGLMKDFADLDSGAGYAYGTNTVTFSITLSWKKLQNL